MPAKVRAHPHLYQVNTWAWLDELSAAAGRSMTLADVPDAEWDRLAELGFDLVYLLGVWKRSIAGRRHFRTDVASFRHFDTALPGWTVESIVGSPFSIQAYVPDARIGSWAEIDAVRERLHARGMRLVLDFVPNHVGPDHPWLASHPEYLLQCREADYQRDPAAFILVESPHGPPLFVARGKDPWFAPWADTAQVDWFEPRARAAMIDTLREIAAHCDGLRCDMAMLVLDEVFARTWAHLLAGRAAPREAFWPAAIAALPPDFLWMAEVYWDMEGVLQAQGFDFTYDKRLYDRLRGGNARELRAHLSASLEHQSHLARFLENHDEHRAAAAYGRERLPGLAALVATLPGLRFFHQGQFEGKSVHLPMPLNAARPEPPDLALRAAYERVLRLADEPLFHEGAWSLLPVGAAGDATHENMLAWRWRSQSDDAVGVLNLSPDAAQARIFIADGLPEGELELTDELDGQRYARHRDDIRQHGLYVRLEAHRAHLFRIRRAPAGPRVS